MSEFEGNDEEVPRTAPKPTAEQIKPPTGPVVPEVSIVMDDSRPLLYRHWENASQPFWRSAGPILNQPANQPGSNFDLTSYPVIATEKTYDEKTGIVTYHPSLPAKNFKTNPKPPRYAPPVRPLKHLTSTQGGAKIYRFKNPTQLRPHSFPPATNRCQFFHPPQYVTVTDFKEFSDNTVKMLKAHEEQIADLKAVIVKIATDMTDLKIAESVGHKTTQKMLQELQSRYVLADKSTLHNLDPEIPSGGGVWNPETQKDKSQPKNAEVVASDAGKQSAGVDHDQRRIIQESPKTVPKSTGAIRKRPSRIPLTDDETADLIVKILEEKQGDADSYNILSGLPPMSRQKSQPSQDKSMAMRELTYKYVPKEKLQQWDMVKEPGKADVSIATRRYMEKYGLIGPTPQEKDEERVTDPRTADLSDKILDAETIKNQPKFM